MRRSSVTGRPKKAVAFSYSEPAVHPNRRKQGVADQLSPALLEVRPEDLAVLLADVEHPRLQALYEDRGFRTVGERRPSRTPLYAVLLAELPLV